MADDDTLSRLMARPLGLGITPVQDINPGNADDITFGDLPDFTVAAGKLSVAANEGPTAAGPG